MRISNSKKQFNFIVDFNGKTKKVQIQADSLSKAEAKIRSIYKKGKIEVEDKIQ